MICEDYLTARFHEHFSLKTNKWKVVLPAVDDQFYMYSCKWILQSTYELFRYDHIACFSKLLEIFRDSNIIPKHSI